MFSAVAGFRYLTSNEINPAIAYADPGPYAEWGIKKWSDVTGFGTAFAAPSFPGSIYGAFRVTFSPTNEYIAYAKTQTLPIGVTVFNWTNNGFGTIFSGPNELNPGWTSSDVKFSNDGTVIFIPMYNVNTDIGEFRAYRWSKNGFGTKYTNAAFEPGFVPRIPNGTDVTRTDSAVMLSIRNDLSVPGLSIWRWSTNTGFGTKYTTPSLAFVVQDGKFRPQEDAIMLSSVLVTGLSFAAYNWNYNTGIGAKFSDPVTPFPVIPPSPDTYSKLNARFTKTGNEVIGGTAGTPFLFAYAWNNGWRSRYPNPSIIPGSGIGATTITSNAVATAIPSPSFSPPAYRWSASGFGTKYTTTYPDFARALDVCFTN